MNRTIKIDEYQKKAVFAKDRNMLICACPGSGKTQVIVNRVNHLVSDLKVKEGNIIILTFTKAAAVNMKNRYLKLFNKNTSPFFGTFHGLFYKMLIKEGLKINIIEGYVAHGIIEGVLKNYFDEINEDKIKEIINEISLFNTSRCSLDSYQCNVSKEIFTNCYNAYSNYKLKNNLLDFDDLSIKAIELLNNKHYLEGYRNLFKYILVDEFQDCDDLQIEFLKIINKGKENSLFAVGDEDQCIYSFRGSKPEYMVTFNEIFRKGKKYYLSRNYRSNKNIVECSKDVIGFNKERNEKEIVASKKEKGIIKFSTPFDEKIQGEEIVNTIRNLVEKEGYNYHDNMILYRTNMESMSIVDTFIRLNIPF
ncbi:MAG: ATP-dependent helicase, partial [Clostridiales bacterium]|nr:ATP-dependent helicase [Clostridiales bacterium]